MKSTFGIAYAAVLASSRISAAYIEAESASDDTEKQAAEEPQEPISRQVRRAMERKRAKAERRRG